MLSVTCTAQELYKTGAVCAQIVRLTLTHCSNIGQVCAQFWTCQMCYQCGLDRISEASSPSCWPDRCQLRTVHPSSLTPNVSKYRALLWSVRLFYAQINPNKSKSRVWSLARTTRSKHFFCFTELNVQHNYCCYDVLTSYLYPLKFYYSAFVSFHVNTISQLQ